MEQKQLDKLKALFREDGIELTDAAALEIGHWLLARAKAVMRPIPPEHREQFDEFQKQTETKWIAWKKDGKIVKLSKSVCKNKI